LFRVSVNFVVVAFFGDMVLSCWKV